MQGHGGTLIRFASASNWTCYSVPIVCRRFCVRAVLSYCVTASSRSMLIRFRLPPDSRKRQALLRGANEPAEAGAVRARFAADAAAPSEWLLFAAPPPPPPLGLVAAAGLGAAAAALARMLERGMSSSSSSSPAAAFFAEPPAAAAAAAAAAGAAPALADEDEEEDEEEEADGVVATGGSARGAAFAAPPPSSAAAAAAAGEIDEGEVLSTGFFAEKKCAMEALPVTGVATAFFDILAFSFVPRKGGLVPENTCCVFLRFLFPPFCMTH